MKYVLALLADWANGQFSVLIACWIVGVNPSWWHFLVGVILSHAPDLDALPELFRRGKVAASAEHAHDHRQGLHYPVVLLAIGSLLVLYSQYWGLIVLVNLVLHLLNDFYGTGWGIKLLWPFSSKQYKLLGRRANLLKSILVKRGEWNTLPESERKLCMVVSWSSEEIGAYINRWGLEDWVTHYYLRLNWISGVEYVLFVTACVLTIIALL